MRQAGLAQDAAGGLYLLDALDLLDADIEQADGRLLDAEHDARHRRAHDREIDEMLRVAADRGADVEHDRFAAHRRPIAAIAGRSIGAIVCRQNLAIAISAPVLPAETAQSAAPRLHRFDRLPHRRDAPARCAGPGSACRSS